MLRIHTATSSCLLLALAILQPLSYDPSDGRCPTPDANTLADLTTLTYMELADIPAPQIATIHAPASASNVLTWLYVSTLLKLIIIRSPKAESIFLESKTLRRLGSLRKLHIKEKDLSRPIQDNFSPAGPEIALCSSLLNLPNLQQLSGRCRALQKGMRAAPLGWQEVEYDEKLSHLAQAADIQLQLRMWKRQ